MADITTGNPLVIDGSSSTARAFMTNPVVVQSVDVITDGTQNWSFRIQDRNGGKTVLRGGFNVAGVEEYEKKIGPTQLKLGYISDLTGIAEILIYKPTRVNED